MSPRYVICPLALACAACGSQPTFQPASPNAAPLAALSSPTPTPMASPTAVAPAAGAIVRPGRRFEMPSWPSSLAFDDAGYAYVSHGSGAFKLDLATGAASPFPGGGVGDRFEVTAGRTIWRISYGGAARYDADGKPLARFEAPSSDWYTIPFAEDRDGNVWVGYDFGSKLYKYAPDGTRLLDLPIACGRGLLLDSQGNVVAGGASEVVWLAPDGTEIRRFPLGKNFNGFAIDADDHVWAAEQDEAGTIYRMSPAGEVRSFTPARQPVQNLHVGPTGDVWFTGRVGTRQTATTLFRMRTDGTYLGSYDLGRAVNTIALDQAGALWVGYASTAPVGETRDFYTGAVAEFLPVAPEAVTPRSPGPELTYSQRSVDTFANFSAPKDCILGEPVPVALQVISSNGCQRALEGNAEVDEARRRVTFTAVVETMHGVPCTQTYAFPIIRTLFTLKSEGQYELRVRVNPQFYRAAEGLPPLLDSEQRRSTAIVDWRQTLTVRQRG